MKLKKITLTSKGGNILYKIATHIYNIKPFPLKGTRIEIVNENKAIVYYKPFQARMKR